MVHVSQVMRCPRGHGSCLWLKPMTTLTLVMGFYELSLRDNRAIKNPMPSRLSGTIHS